MKLKGIIVALSLSLYGASHPHYIIDEHNLSEMSEMYGPFARKRVETLLDLMNEIKDSNETVKIEKINAFVNKVPYALDMTTWGKKDYWATLCEVLGSDRADCEDYVIVKFFLLKMLGIDTSKLYFTHAKAIKYKFSSHLVLTYYPTYDAIPYVLDNLNHKVLPATARNDLVVLGTYSSDDLNNVAHSPLGKKLRAAAQQEKPFNDLGIKLSPP